MSYEKVIVISIRPEHALNILNGNKTLELRKSIPKDYVGWVYVYVTKGGGRLSVVHDDENGETYYYLNSNWGRSLNQDIPFRFWFDEYIKLEWLDPSLNIKRNDVNYYNYYALFENIYNNVEWILPNLCLTKQQVIDYGKERDLYAWHIKKLEVFDKPMFLSELYGDFAFSDTDEYGRQHTPFHIPIPLKRPPQSWQYAYILGAKQ